MSLRLVWGRDRLIKVKGMLVFPGNTRIFLELRLYFFLFFSFSAIAMAVVNCLGTRRVRLFCIQEGLSYYHEVKRLSGINHSGKLSKTQPVSTSLPEEGFQVSRHSVLTDKQD